MLDHADLECLFAAIDSPQNYELASTLVPQLDAAQQREVLHVVASQSPTVGDDVRRRAFVQSLITAHPGVVHAQGAFGETALHVAAYWRNVELMRLLLDNGSDLDARTPRAWHYNDGKLPKGTTPRSILDAALEDALAHDQPPNVVAPGSFDRLATRVLGVSFEQWVTQLRSKKTARKPRR